MPSEVEGNLVRGYLGMRFGRLVSGTAIISHRESQTGGILGLLQVGGASRDVAGESMSPKPLKTADVD